MIYLPFGGSWYVVRTAGPAAASVRMVEQALAGSLRTAVVRAQPMTSHLEAQSLPVEIASTVLAALGGLGLLLAMTGLYAVVNYAVSCRTFEIGVRIALGAPRAAVLWMIVRHGLGVVATGCAAGMAAALALAAVVRKLLGLVTVAGHPVLDPLAFAAVLATLLVVGAVATLWPARRAARMDAALALRHS
jgi:putative ABC transport system permease protein